MAKVSTVEHAYKDQGKCGRCGVEIKKGDPYRHASPGFRAPKKIRCMKPECRFRQSELTTSLLADVYAAQEDADDALDQVGLDFEDAEDVITILEECASAGREVAQAYTDAAEAMGSAGEEHQDRADMIESWCDDLDSPSFDDAPDPDDEDYKDDSDALEDAWTDWRENVITTAHDLVNGLEL